MKTSERRKYRGGDFGVAVGTRVPPTAFDEIEALAKKLGTTRSGIARSLLLRGLAEFHRDGRFIAEPAIMPGEQSAGGYSNVKPVEAVAAITPHVDPLCL